MSLRPLIAILVSTLVGTTGTAQVTFTNVTAAAGIPAELHQALNFHSNGLLWIDYDNDGDVDLLATNGINLSAHLYENNGDGTFTARNNLLPNMPNTEMSGGIFADFDNDGDSDIYVMTDNGVNFSLFGANDPDGDYNMMLRNDWVENGNQVLAGQSLFRPWTAQCRLRDDPETPLGVKPGRRAMTGGWLDYDRDGHIDVYVGHMVLQAPGDPANMDRLYRNVDGVFEDVTMAAGVGSLDPTTYRPALAFIGAHLDDDLWPDMYVVNVHETSPYHHDFVYKNNGDGTFTEVSGLSPGMGDDSGSGMGVDVADFDNDGDWDIYISDLLNTSNDSLPLGNAFYEGNGDGTFSDNRAVEAGVTGLASWGVNFFDADQDGDEDLFVATLGSGKDIMYENNGDGTFSNITDSAGFLEETNNRGSAVADYDNDGDLDLATIEQAGVVRLYRNDTPGAGHWLQIKLIGRSSNRDAIGAVVEVDTGSVTRKRQIKGGSSTHSQDSLVVHFGLGGAAVADEVRIYWPSGRVERFADVPADQKHTFVESRFFQKFPPSGNSGPDLGTLR